MAVSARLCRIAKLTTPTIEIGGQAKKTGDYFDSRDSIAWQTPRQAMKVIDISSGAQTLMVGEKAEATKAGNLEEYLMKNRRMSSRDGMPDNILSLKTMLKKEDYFLIDTLEIATAIPTDSNRFFYVSYEYKGEEINKLIPNLDGHFFITTDIFKIDGSPIPPYDVTLSLFYLDKTSQKLNLVTDNLHLYVLAQGHQ